MDPFTATTTVAGAIHLAGQIRDTAFSVHDNVSDVAKYIHTGSLVDISKMARVEPICIIDADVLNVEYITDVVQSMQSIFAGYYLQAIALTGNIGNVSIAQRLAPLNPNRETIFESMKPDIRLAAESHKYRLPTSKNMTNVSLEAVAASTNKDANSTTMELSNLSIGKIYDVELTDGKGNSKTDANGNKVNTGGACVTIKIAIRLMSTSMPTSVLVNMFTFKDSFDMDMGERYHAWRSGRLSFIKDLILCRDLVDKHRTALAKDKSGVYAQILNRENNNFKAGLFNKNPSMATASNLTIISSDTVAQMEQKLGGKLSNFKVRQQIFDNTNLMIMAVIDKNWERTTFYHRGIQESTQVSIRDMKVANKGGDNVTDIMKAFMAGSSPNI